MIKWIHHIKTTFLSRNLACKRTKHKQQHGRNFQGNLLIQNRTMKETISSNKFKFLKPQVRNLAQAEKISFIKWWKRKNFEVIFTNNVVNWRKYYFASILWWTKSFCEKNIEEVGTCEKWMGEENQFCACNVSIQDNFFCYLLVRRDWSNRILT